MVPGRRREVHRGVDLAEVAAAHGISFVCVPAGTRNHFALDLGADRHDLAGVADAFTDGGRRQMGVAEMNGRTFVNNFSQGPAMMRSAARPIAMPRCVRCERPRLRRWARTRKRLRCGWPTTWAASMAIRPSCS